MHFMVLILLFLLGAVLWGFFHSNPQGVPRVKLALVNGAILVAALIIGAMIGSALYADAISVKAGEKGMATYLAIMAAGTAFLIVVAAGGLVRNLLVFPISRRAPTESGPP
ncbi:MAG: hypothetical protein AMJ64_00400 [Betaproteobacteria bacterium SG8_39]|nr:MAG: hypothetical protein AMJ64_00400 [Betaproteobacteria bacterium SG8_39]